MKVLQINTTYGIGSTGKIVLGIDKLLKSNNIESYVGYGYGKIMDEWHYQIGNQLSSYSHNLFSRITDGQGLYSNHATRKFIAWVDRIQPDIIHLHNIHGNYLNYVQLFEYLKSTDCKVVWTMHDCWPFTGHCAYFDMVKCDKWMKLCDRCPQLSSYPFSFIDRSKRNYEIKKRLFTSLDNRLVLVPVSHWLEGLLKHSYFINTKVKTIHNGIDISSFRIFNKCASKDYVLGVASAWSDRKGLHDFIQLRDILDDSIEILLVGLTHKQIRSLPKGIIGITRTNSQAELANLYTNAIVTINPTYEDNYPTVNLESIACGTPVITYDTGGSPESLVGRECGIVVKKADILSIKVAISEIINSSSEYRRDLIRRYAETNFDETKCFQAYINLYNSLML